MLRVSRFAFGNFFSSFKYWSRKFPYFFLTVSSENKENKITFFTGIYQQELHLDKSPLHSEYQKHRLKI